MAIDILPNQPSFSERLALGLSNAGQLLGGAIPQRHLEQQRKQALSQLMPGLENLHPEFQKMALEYKLKGDVERQKRESDLKGDKYRSDTIRKYFGDKEADIYDAASEGGKTKIMEDLIDRERRNTSFDENFNNKRTEMGLSPDIGIQEGEAEPTERPSERVLDFDRGTTPAERTRRQDKRYTTNLPLYTDLVDKKEGLESESHNLGILADLTDKISGLERLNINPQTGDFFLPFIASGDAQQYVKTINDFTRNAKQSYGARVTNFDLQQFMKRLPTLANSAEGRKRIIQQLQIINQLDHLRAQALKDVIEDYGGIRNIDWDKAKDLADKRIEKKRDRLIGEFKNIGSDLDSEYKNQVNAVKKKTRPGYVAIRTKDGQLGELPKEKLQKFLEDGAGEEL